MTNKCIHTCNGAQQLVFENIVRVESKSNYCKIFFADNANLKVRVSRNVR
jgi:hypothetical protein